MNHILLSNAYQTRARQDVIRLSLISEFTLSHVHHTISSDDVEAVAIAIRDYKAAVDHSRKLITAHQFENEPLRILLASLCSGFVPTDSFITSTLQKHLYREMKLSDTAVRHPETLKWNPLNKRYAPNGSKATEQEQDEEDNDDISRDVGASSTGATAPEAKSDIPPIPTDFNPVIITIYGQICIAAKSYQSAICVYSDVC